MFCKSGSLEEIRRHNYVLTPGMWGAAAEDDDVPFVERFAALGETLTAQFAESERLITLRFVKNFAVFLSSLGGML